MSQAFEIEEIPILRVIVIGVMKQVWIIFKRVKGSL